MPNRLASFLSHTTPLLAGLALLGACDQSSVAGSTLVEKDEQLVEPNDDAQPRPSLQMPSDELVAAVVPVEPVAQLPGLQLDIGLTTNDVHLEWEDMGADEYEVWTSPDAYFQPGDYGSTLLGTIPGTGAIHNGGNEIDGRRYYVIQAVGDASLRTTTVGRHPITLEEGFNKLPISLETEHVDASDVYDALAGYADILYQFIPGAQQWQSWDPENDTGAFQIIAGTTPVADMNTAATWTYSGHVPMADVLAVDLHAGDNLVYLPLHYPTLDASEVLALVPGATQVGRWNAVTQQIEWYTGPGTPDVELSPGDDLHVWMGQDGSWPVDAGEAFGSCCESNGSTYCEDAIVTQCVCATDSYCCNYSWDSICANEVESLGCGTCGA